MNSNLYLHRSLIRGHSVELDLVDACLRKVSKASFVASLLDNNAQAIVSFVEAECIDQPKILAELRLQLPSYMIPSRIVALDNMPLRPNRKIDRKILHALLDGGL